MMHGGSLHEEQKSSETGNNKKETLSSIVDKKKTIHEATPTTVQRLWDEISIMVDGRMNY